MTIVTTSKSCDTPSNAKPSSRGIKKPKISFHKREHSKLRDLEIIPLNDGLLQSTSSHRRYLRRGSRTPMMIQTEAVTTMMTHDPSLNEPIAPNVDDLLQSSSSHRRCMRRGSRTPMMFQLDAAAMISHDPSFDFDTLPTLLQNPMVPPPTQPERCSSPS